MLTQCSCPIYWPWGRRGEFSISGKTCSEIEWYIFFDPWFLPEKMSSWQLGWIQAVLFEFVLYMNDTSSWSHNSQNQWLGGARVGRDGWFRLAMLSFPTAAYVSIVSFFGYFGLFLVSLFRVKWSLFGPFKGLFSWGTWLTHTVDDAVLMVTSKEMLIRKLMDRKRTRVRL